MSDPFFDNKLKFLNRYRIKRCILKDRMIPRYALKEIGWGKMEFNHLECFVTIEDDYVFASHHSQKEKEHDQYGWELFPSTDSEQMLTFVRTVLNKNKKKKKPVPEEEEPVILPNKRYAEKFWLEELQEKIECYSLEIPQPSSSFSSSSSSF